MNLREKILKEHSKTQCSRIVAWIGNDQKRFDELFKLFTTDEYRAVQRSAWPVSNCVLEHPGFIQKHFATLIKNVKKPGLHNAVKRNTLRLLQIINIPEKYRGEIMVLCFECIQSPSEKVGAKAFALTVLKNLSADYPGIVPEVKLIIEERLPYETAAFRSRAKQFMKSADGF